MVLGLLSYWFAGAPILPQANTQAKAELADLVASLQDTQPVGPLVAKCRTLDQARAVVTFLDATSEKTLRSTVALTATRGRGKVCHQASPLSDESIAWIKVAFWQRSSTRRLVNTVLVGAKRAAVLASARMLLRPH